MMAPPFYYMADSDYNYQIQKMSNIPKVIFQPF